MRRKWVTKRGEICWAILAVETFTKFLILVDSNDARIIVILKDLHAYLLNSILLLTYIFLEKLESHLNIEVSTWITTTNKILSATVVMNVLSSLCFHFPLQIRLMLNPNKDISWWDFECQARSSRTVNSIFLI